MSRRALPTVVVLSSILAAAAGVGAGAGEMRRRETGNENEDEALSLAMAVDSPEWPEEAAALEGRPYRMLLGRARLGADERTLRTIAVAVRVGDKTLLRNPEAFRGAVVHGFGVLGEVRRVEAPGVGRFDRDEVHAGVVGTPQGRFFAFRALRRPNEARLYAGDRVWVSGYFMKVVPVVDARGRTHRLPLVVSPWPTYTGKSLSRGGVRRLADALGFPTPTSEVPHDEVLSRRVLDVEELPATEDTEVTEHSAAAKDGGGTFDKLRLRRAQSSRAAVVSASKGGGRLRLAVDGAALPREDAVLVLKRDAAAHPRRVVVVRAGGDGARLAARRLLAEAGVERVCFKGLRPSPVRPRAQ